ncbi:MAG: hypothetical protein AAB628_03395 [Patescibacteria group bacterium]
MIIKQFIVIFLLSFTMVLSVHAQEPALKNAGFVPSNIWYSKEPFFAGEKIRVYTIIFNGSTSDLVGNVEFFDNGASFGKAPFSLPGGGRVRDIWVDYTAKEGNHVITARLVQVEVVEAGGVKRKVLLENSEAGKSEQMIDLDTDADGIGNRDDPDDDNDTIADIEEIKNGTDPIKKDSDGNGISDGQELKIKIAEAEKEQKSLLEKTGTSTPLDSVYSAVNKVNDAIPQNVKEKMSSGANVVESFRLGQGYQFGLNKEAKEKEIEAISIRQKAYTSIPEEDKAKTSGLDAFFGTVEKPFTYVLLGIFAALEYVFTTKILFYGIILYFLYRFIKWGVYKVRSR